MRFNKRSIILNYNNITYIFDIIKSLKPRMLIITRPFLLSFNKNF